MGCTLPLFPGDVRDSMRGPPGGSGVIPENIRLISQPAYSPEVNPVEHLWEELREKYLSNRVFSSLDLLIEVLCRGLNELTDDPQRLRSMMFFPHFRMQIRMRACV
jgi:hypothetical protein